MSSDTKKFQQHLVAIHILEEGVSVHSEQFQEMLGINNVLTLGFLTALYNYTFSIGREEISFIDFNRYKFLFSVLYDDRLLVVITDASLSDEEEEILLEKLKLRYEVLSQDKPIAEITSLLTAEEGIIPIELVAEIRRKGLMKKPELSLAANESTFNSEVQMNIPEIKTESFYLQPLVGEQFINDKMVIKVKKALSNFFLGYKKLIACVVAFNINEELLIFVFGRRSYNDSIELIEKVLKESTLKPVTGNTEEKLRKIELGEKYFWILPNIDEENKTSYVFISKSRSELISLDIHIKRIQKFLVKFLSVDEFK
ncbi:MAG: hypothetical protein ACTSPI_15980 [Candidatus Heimdallarchaeaceae archaeon]